MISVFFYLQLDLIIDDLVELVIHGHIRCSEHSFMLLILLRITKISFHINRNDQSKKSYNDTNSRSFFPAQNLIFIHLSALFPSSVLSRIRFSFSESIIKFVFAQVNKNFSDFLYSIFRWTEKCFRTDPANKKE